MKTFRSDFEVLGVSDLASAEEIKKAFRTLSKTLHPDSGGNENDFQELQGAYERIVKGCARDRDLDTENGDSIFVNERRDDDKRANKRWRPKTSLGCLVFVASATALSFWMWRFTGMIMLQFMMTSTMTTAAVVIVSRGNRRD